MFGVLVPTSPLASGRTTAGSDGDTEREAFSLSWRAECGGRAPRAVTARRTDASPSLLPPVRASVRQQRPDKPSNPCGPTVKSSHTLSQGTERMGGLPDTFFGVVNRHMPALFDRAASVDHTVFCRVKDNDTPRRGLHCYGLCGIVDLIHRTFGNVN